MMKGIFVEFRDELLKIKKNSSSRIKTVGNINQSREKLRKLLRKIPNNSLKELLGKISTKVSHESREKQQDSYSGNE